MIYEILDEERQEYTVRTLTSVLEVSKSTSKYRCPSPRSQVNEQLKQEILQIYEKSKRCYGTPKIIYKLKQLGWRVGIKRVQRLMRELGVYSVIRKKYRPATNHEKSDRS